MVTARDAGLPPWASLGSPLRGYSTADFESVLVGRWPGKKMPSLNYLNIAIPDVYIRVGSIDQTHVSQSDLRPKRPFEAKRYGLMFHWQRSLSWLSIQLRHGDPPEDFADERDGLLAVCAAVGADPDHVAPAKFLQSQQYQIATVNRDAPVQIRVRVDTDDERFRQAVLAQDKAAEREEF